MRVQINKKIERVNKLIKRKTFKIVISSALIGGVIIFNIGQTANAIVSDVTPSTATTIANSIVSTGTEIVNSTDTSTVATTGTSVIDTSKKFSINGLLFKDDNKYQYNYNNTPFIDGDVTMYNSFGRRSSSVFNRIDIGASISFSDGGTTTAADNGVQISYIITREGDSNYREVLEDMNTNIDKYYRHGDNSFDHVSWTPWKAGIYNIQAIAKDKYGNTEKSPIRRVNVIEDGNARNFTMNLLNGFYGARQYVEGLSINKSSCNIGESINVNVKLDTADKLGENFSQITKCRLLIENVDNSFDYYEVIDPSVSITERNIGYLFDGNHGIGAGTYNISLILEPKYYNYNYDSNSIQYTIYDGFVVKSATDTVTYSDSITVATVSTATISSVPVATKQTTDVPDGTNANINGAGTIPGDTITIVAPIPTATPTSTISTTTPQHITIPFTGDTKNEIVIMIFFLSGIAGIFVFKKKNSARVK